MTNSLEKTNEYYALAKIKQQHKALSGPKNTA